MKKISTVQAIRNDILKQQKLTIGIDLGDRWSFYCVLDEGGTILLEQKVATTPEAVKQTFGRIPDRQHPANCANANRGQDVCPQFPPVSGSNLDPECV